MNRRDLLLALLALPRMGAAGSREGRAADGVGGIPDGRLRPVYDFDFDWRFHLGDITGGETVDFDDSQWQPVQLPHDWSIELPFREDVRDSAPGDYSEKGIGWYRKTFDLPSEFDGKILVDFDGIYQNSQVWLNGELVGGRAYGMVPFQIDLTRHARWGQRNVLAVRVDNETGPKARWYSGSGINRHVRLSFPRLTRIPPGGVRVTTVSLSGEFAELRIEVDVLNESAAEATIVGQTTVTSPDSLNEGLVTTAALIPAGETRTLIQSMFLRTPAAWSPESPNLYQIRCEIKVGETIIDDEVSRFGVRLLHWHPDFGMLLNGRTTKLRGVCLHVDCGAVGTGVPDQTFERRLRILKTIGCNAIRIAHHPAPAELLDLCDELGFLVIEEAFDKWNLGFAEGYEHPNFAQDWDRDLMAMFTRDRHHPSIIAWSLGNEAGLAGTDDHDKTLADLVSFARTFEPTRAVTCAFLGTIEGTIEDNAGAILKAGGPLDFLSLNYQERYFPVLRETNPSAIILASESYPFFRSVFGGVEPINSWYDAAGHPWVVGGFVWTGYDYLGESAGWPSKGWPNGLIDTCGFVKPQSSFFRAAWSNRPEVGIYAVNPDAQIDLGLEYWRSLPGVMHWNLKENTVYAVCTPSNAESVELVVDGTSYGRKAIAESANQTIVWFVRHQRGEVRAVARNGEEIVAEASLRSAGEAAAIRIEMDRPILRDNGHDVCHVEISLVDSNGVVVPDADLQVRMGISGPASIIGIDNGDLRSAEPYQGGHRTTYHGRCLATIRAGRQAGHVQVWADANGLPSQYFDIEIEASPSERETFPPTPRMG